MSLHGGAERQLSRDHWFLLFILGMAVFLEGFNVFCFAAALPEIRRSFDLTQSQASMWIGLVFVGSIPAIFLARYADIRGRRRLLLGSLVCYSFFTFSTALSSSVATFVFSQLLARLFLNAVCAIAWTMVAEELPASSRGFGFGWLAMLSATGGAFAAGLYGVVFAPLDVSWRALYFVALAPISVILFLRHGLSETRRFMDAKENQRLARHWYEILAKPYRRWVVLSSITDLLFGLAVIGDVFMVDHMQTSRGVSPTTANVILSAAGLLAIPAALGAGSLSDRYGRKTVGCSFALMSVVGALGFFLLGRTPIDLFAYLLLLMMGQFGAWPTLDAFYAELFPTELRALASGAATAGQVPGEFLGMLVGSALVAVTSLGVAVAILSIGPVVAIVIIWKFFPSTHGRDLSVTRADRLQPERLPLRVAG